MKTTEGEGEKDGGASEGRQRGEAQNHSTVAARLISLALAKAQGSLPVFPFIPLKAPRFLPTKRTFSDPLQVPKVDVQDLRLGDIQ